MKKKPYYLFAWLLGEAAFFITIAVVALYIVLNAISGATSGSITLFTNWYQTLLFILDVLCFVGIGVFVYLTIRENKKRKKEGDKNV